MILNTLHIIFYLVVDLFNIIVYLKAPVLCRVIKTVPEMVPWFSGGTIPKSLPPVTYIDNSSTYLNILYFASTIFKFLLLPYYQLCNEGSLSLSEAKYA